MPLPLYGTCSASSHPARSLKSSAVRCEVVPVPGRGDRDAPGRRAHERDEIRERLHAERRIDDQHLAVAREPRDRREILARVVAELRIDAHARGERRRDDEQRVAVVGRFRDARRREIAARAGMIVDDERLLEELGERGTMTRARMSLGSPGEAPTTTCTVFAGYSKYAQPEAANESSDTSAAASVAFISLQYTAPRRRSPHRSITQWTQRNSEGRKVQCEMN